MNREVCLRKKGKSMRIFCFPYAGGGAHVFREWPDFLPKEILVVPVQLPGHGSWLKKAPFKHLQPLVQELAGDLSFDSPFVFFGHSMGALIAFELSRELRRRNLPRPDHLFVSAHGAPQVKRVDSPSSRLSTPEFLEKLRRLDGTPPEVLEHPDLMEIFLPILRADFELVETYEYQKEAPLECPLSVFGGIQDPDVSRADLDAWRGLTHGPFSLSMFPGDHFFLHQEKRRLLKQIAQKIL
ncbi:MAG TPA: putative thioesterase [Deltaproteobacteria bacterium]|nr:putative thioesterase [Deltaproteobacteria bacterium]